MARDYNVPGIVTGFEPLDILRAIITLVYNINNKNIVVENHYSRIVAEEGNPIAYKKMVPL
jgi:hydrogenase expression/formation protein HypD